MQEENMITEEAFKQYILNKKLTCDICSEEFTEYIVRTQKLRFISSDDDLHPVYRDIEPLLYDVIICPHCGYAAMTMFFNKVASKQRAVIRKEIAAQHQPTEWNRLRTYKEAIERYNIALLVANIKGAKSSELGYLYTKTAWLARLSGNDAGYKIYTNRALKEFENAYLKEDFPICQMDETTFEYLLAYLYFITGDKDNAMKLLGRIITNLAAPQRIKEKSHNLKEHIQELAKGRD